MSRFTGDKFGSRRFNGDMSFTKQRTVRLCFKTPNDCYFDKYTIARIDLALSYFPDDC
jgi:hypothetical protein